MTSSVKKKFLGAIFLIMLIWGFSFLNQNFFPGKSNSEENNSAGTVSLGSKQADDVSYGDRTPECLEPQVSHLCSDYSSEGDGRAFSTHFFSVVCSDSCGQVYKFKKSVKLQKFNEQDGWEPSSDNQLFAEDFQILQRPKASQDIQEAQKRLDDDEAQAKEKAKSLGARASELWKEIVRVHPADVVKSEAGKLNFRGEDVPSAMWRNFSSVGGVTGHLTQLIASAKAIAEALKRTDDRQNELRSTLSNQLTATVSLFKFIDGVETDFQPGSEPSLMGLIHLNSLSANLRALGPLTMVSKPALMLLEALVGNQEIQKLVHDQGEVQKSAWDRNAQRNDLERRFDPSASDPKKTERCVGFTSDKYEVYPSRSALKESLEKTQHEIKSQIQDLKAQSVRTTQQFSDAISSSSDHGAASQFKSMEGLTHAVVRFESQSRNLVGENLWTSKLFDQLDREMNQKGKLDLLTKIHSDCALFDLMKWGDKKEEKSLAPGQVATARVVEKVLRDGDLVLMYSHALKTTHVLLEVRYTGNKFQGTLYVSSQAETAPRLTDLCILLSGLCMNFDQISESKTPFITIALPSGGKIPTSLPVFIRRVAQNNLLERLKILKDEKLSEEVGAPERSLKK